MSDYDAWLSTDRAAEEATSAEEAYIESDSVEEDAVAWFAANPTNSQIVFEITSLYLDSGEAFSQGFEKWKDDHDDRG